jgi:hypothetical protein
MKALMIVLACVLCVFAGFFANGLMEKHATEITAAQNAKAFDSLPLCGGRDPAQTALDSGGKCRPF